MKFFTQFVDHTLLVCIALFVCLGGIGATACHRETEMPQGGLNALSIQIGGVALNLTDPAQNRDFPVNQPVYISFNLPISVLTLNAGIQLLDAQNLPVHIQFSVDNDNKTVIVRPVELLAFGHNYTLAINSNLKSADGLICTAVSAGFRTFGSVLAVDSIVTGGIRLQETAPARDVNPMFQARIFFNASIDPGTVSSSNVKVYRAAAYEGLHFTFEKHDSVLVLNSNQPLSHLDKYTLSIGNGIRGLGGSPLSGFTRTFYTALDPTPKFPPLSDDALLDLVQQQTFKYFWDFGHPVSGLSRERDSSGDIVTSGGSGFGVMSIIVGIERGFITRAEGVARWKKIVGFLKNKAQRFHGAWPHWLNGSSGVVVPFSQKDNGADLVETSYLIQGLLTVRQYLNPADSEEAALITDIQYLWETVEWDWFTRGGQNVLYWHWSPNYNWEMNHQIKGYNECLITYFLAACSPTHPISAEVYHKGWASSGSMKNNQTYYGYRLPVGFAYGGPLFFAHYSFLGLDPRHLKDIYADYWEQNTHHSLINRAYCIANPLKKVGYSAECWGLTASDNQSGYSAHSPTNDLGVITPTAALSSFPYTPAESMAALRFFYDKLGDKIWGPHGFYDAFNPTEGWYGRSYLAIDQGPIIVMIENHRSGKLWQLFMNSPEVAIGANLLGFTY